MVALNFPAIFDNYIFKKVVVSLSFFHTKNQKSNKMKSKLLIIATLFFNLSVFAQTATVAIKQRCASEVPSQEWNDWFNKKVEEHKQNLANGRAKSSTGYIIPVIFHIIYHNEAEGTFPNLDTSLIRQQIQILNADYAGTGYNTSLYAGMGSGGHLPFYNYAQTNSLPAPDNNGVAIANTGISFILATVDATGHVLTEPGIDRVSWSSRSWSSPSSFNSVNSFQNYINNTVKPNTIWDPTKYFNVWVTDESSSVGLLGFSTFPTGTTLSGLTGGGTGTASNSTDGVWVWSSSVGNSGTANAPYNYGRTLTHESGHYFGLRHVWGDGQCLTDYCNDIPQAKQANYVGLAGYPGTTTAASYPYNIGTCSSGAYNNSQDGEMFMNFMDYSDDDAMWMFTNDQVTRMHTALTQSPNRSGLTASANSMMGTVVKATICSGNTYTYNSHTYSTTGTYKDTLTNYLGGDSIITTQLTVNPKSHKTIVHNMCSGNSYSFFGNSLTVSGTYKDSSLMNHFGCDSVVTLILSVSNIKSYKTITHSMCAGNSYNFFGNNITMGGTFKDSSLMNYLGCDSVITLQLAINPLPNIPTFTANTNTCVLTCDSSAVAYQWYQSSAAISGATQQTYAASQSGNYSVKVTDANGCSNTSAILNVNCFTGIESLNKNNISLYPNPTNGSATIAFSNAVNNASVKISNVIGQTLFVANNQSSNQIVIDLSKQAKGIYFIEVHQNDEVWRDKIVKE